MKLILSSCDFRDDKARKTIIDHLGKSIEQCRVLFIPNEKATVEAIRSEKYYSRLQEFGFQRDNVLVFDYWKPEDFAGRDIDAIYISGGNTFRMMKRIRDSGFDKEIVRYAASGVIYIGGSAGAHIASENIGHVSLFDSVPDDFSNFDGLGLFEGILICHYTPDRKAIYDRLNQQGKYKVYALTDEESLVISDREIHLMSVDQ